MTKIKDQRIAHIVAETLGQPQGATAESIHDPRFARAHAIVENAKAGNDWAAQIMSSPEARLRPRAAARIIELSSPDKKSAAACIETLRGIPVEGPSARSDVLAPETLQVEADPRAARIEQLRIVGLQMKADKGDLDAKRELRKLRATGAL